MIMDFPPYGVSRPSKYMKVPSFFYRWFTYTPRWVQTGYARLSRKERILLIVFIFILFISGPWTVIGYVNRHTHVVAKAGGTYHEAAVGQPRHINPILAGNNDVDVDVSRLTYSSLFQHGPNLELQNDLATGYELSTDNRQYTIRLRTDVRWHDNTPFTANDVIFTIGSIQTPEYSSPLSSAFQGVTVEKVDDYTVRFTLKQPYAPFLHSLTVGIVPQHVWQNISPKNAALAEQVLKPIGTGPFKFAELTSRRRTGEITSIRLVRNDNYYGPRPYLDEIIFSFFSAHEEAQQALLSRRVDGVSFLPIELATAFAGRSNFSIHPLLLPQYFALFFNQERNVVLRDTGVRDALSLAINRQDLVEEALGGQGEPLHLPIPPGGAYNAELPPPPTNLDTARQNLHEAGWQDTDGDGFREKSGQSLQLKITTTDWPEYVKTAQYIQRQWQSIGVKTEVEHVGAGTIQQTIVSPRQYEILLFGEILSAEPDPYPFWHSSQAKSPGLNFALFQDKSIDKLLEEGRQTLDQNARYQKYNEFQAKILDLKPAIILYRPYYLFATRSYVHGLNVKQVALPADRFNTVEAWHVKTRRVWN